MQLLNLGYGSITDAGLRHLSNLRNLSQLYLYVTQITDAGLKYLRELQSLEMLELFQTKITDKQGLASLNQALANCDHLSEGMISRSRNHSISALISTSEIVHSLLG